MEYLRQCLSTDIEPIEKAGLLPTSTHIQTFSDALEQLGMRHGTKNLHTILQQFNDIASVKSDYFVCRQDPMVHIAKAIAPYDLAIVRGTLNSTWSTFILSKPHNFLLFRMSA
jgi:hypothetical protein